MGLFFLKAIINNKKLRLTAVPMSTSHFSTPYVSPTKAINLHETLPLFQGERQYPHSTLNLKNTVKISPTIYKYHNFTTNKASSRLDRRQYQQKKKRICSLTTFNLNQLLQKSLTTVNGNNKNFVKAQRNWSSPDKKQIKNSKYTAPSKIRMPSKDWLSNGPFKFAQTFQVNDYIPAKSKPKSTFGLHSSRKINFLDKKQRERGQYSSRSKRRSSQRFMPWDLQNGFGKSKRF